MAWTKYDSSGRRLGVGDAGPTGPMPDGEFWLGACGGTPSTTGGCATAVQVEFGTNDVDLWLADFDDTAIEYMQWGGKMPDDWDGGTVTAKFVWIADSAVANNVIWGLQGVGGGDGDAVDAAWGAAQEVTDTNTGQNQYNISAATAAITLAGAGSGEHMQLRCYRNGAAGGDNLVGDARLRGVAVYYTRS